MDRYVYNKDTRTKTEEHVVLLSIKTCSMQRTDQLLAIQQM